MKTASADLITLLNTADQVYSVDLFEFDLLDGTTLRYTNADLNIKVGSDIYYCNSALVESKNNKIKISCGISVDTAELELYAETTDILSSGMPILQSMRLGLWDEATCHIHKLFSATPLTYQYIAPVSSDYVVADWFLGIVNIDSLTRLHAKLKITALTYKLNIKMPRNTWQPACLNTLYDTVCIVNKNDFKASSSATAGSTKSTVNCGLSQASGYFDLGYAVFTSGDNSGFTRTVKSYTPGVINFIVPLIYTPQIGDTFDIYPGCDRSRSTCETKFNNLANFKGMPFIPKPQTPL